MCVVVGLHGGNSVYLVCDLVIFECFTFVLNSFKMFFYTVSDLI